MWPELRPFLDRRTLEGARSLGLPGTPERLAGLVDGGDLARLSAALVRATLDDTIAERVRAGRNAADH